MIKFTILGKPRALQRHRIAKNGRMYDPSYKDKKQIMLQIAKYKPIDVLTGAICLSIRFTMPRPKSHYRTGKFKHLLKDNVPMKHTKKPDLDNLTKMIADILQPDFYKDDSQICELYAEKIYGERPNTAVIIQEVP